MVKSIVTVLVTLSILIAGAAFEQTYIHREFGDFAAVVETLDEKVTTQTATEEDALAVQKNWLTHKEHMHVFIPHTEIKEIDLWLSETVSYVKSQNWEEARAKIEVLAELVEQRGGAPFCGAPASFCALSAKCLSSKYFSLSSPEAHRQRRQASLQRARKVAF